MAEEQNPKITFEREVASVEVGNATDPRGNLVPVKDMRLLHLFHRGLRHDLSVPLSKEEANKFALHTGRKVRVTVELLPEEPEPARPAVPPRSPAKRSHHGKAPVTTGVSVVPDPKR